MTADYMATYSAENMFNVCSALRPIGRDHPDRLPAGVGDLSRYHQYSLYVPRPVSVPPVLTLCTPTCPGTTSTHPKYPDLSRYHQYSLYVSRHVPVPPALTLCTPACPSTTSTHSMYPDLSQYHQHSLNVGLVDGNQRGVER